MTHYTYDIENTSIEDTDEDNKHHLIELQCYDAVQWIPCQGQQQTLFDTKESYNG